MQLECSDKQLTKPAADPYLPALRRAAKRAALRDRIATAAGIDFLPEDIELLIDQILSRFEQTPAPGSVAYATVDHSQCKT